jgi:hypothetical protein
MPHFLEHESGGLASQGEEERGQLAVLNPGGKGRFPASLATWYPLGGQRSSNTLQRLTSKSMVAKAIRSASPRGLLPDRPFDIVPPGRLNCLA